MSGLDTPALMVKLARQAGLHAVAAFIHSQEDRLRGLLLHVSARERACFRDGLLCGAAMAVVAGAAVWIGYAALYAGR